MRLPPLFACAVAALVLLPGTALARDMSYLDNGLVRVGVDLDKGGVITHLSVSGGGFAASVVNDHDLGRQVQQSYYSGPADLGIPCRETFLAAWNPIGAGDCYGHASRILGHSNDGTTIYVKSAPLQWAFDSVPCECTFEQWIELDGRAVRVRNRLHNFRADRTPYPAYGQELPAVYTIGRLPHLLTYAGALPYTGRPLTEILAGSPSTRWQASERWAAHVDDAGWGLGVFNPSASTFIGGFFGRRGAGGPLDVPTGYIAPTRSELLDWNIVYDYEYALVLGTLDEIRAYAVARRPDPRPDFQFAGNRQGWWYVNARDSGFPTSDAVHVSLDEPDPQMWSPDGWWSAADVPVVYVRMALEHVPPGQQGEVFWAPFGGAFSNERTVSFALRADGRFHTYRIDLAAAPGYTGAIGRLRLDPVVLAARNGRAAVDYVSWRPQRRTLNVTAQGAGSVVTEPAGVACPSACSAPFDDAATVALRARPRPGFALAAWSGACRGHAPTCVLTIEGDAGVTGRFAPVHRRTLRLRVAARVAEGRLRAADGHPLCGGRQQVQLQRRLGGSWAAIGRTRTSASGEFVLRRRFAGGVYRALAPQSEVAGHLCGVAVSGGVVRE